MMIYTRSMNKVTEYRIKQDLTQRDLAEKVGVYQPYISRLEAGEVAPSVILAYKIARALRATVEEIFGEGG